MNEVLPLLSVTKTTYTPSKHPIGKAFTTAPSAILYKILCLMFGAPAPASQMAQTAQKNGFFADTQIVDMGLLVSGISFNEKQSGTKLRPIVKDAVSRQSATSSVMIDMSKIPKNMRFDPEEYIRSVLKKEGVPQQQKHIKTQQGHVNFQTALNKANSEALDIQQQILRFQASKLANQAQVTSEDVSSRIDEEGSKHLKNLKKISNFSLDEHENTRKRLYQGIEERNSHMKEQINNQLDQHCQQMKEWVDELLETEFYGLERLREANDAFDEDVHGALEVMKSYASNAFPSEDDEVDVEDMEHAPQPAQHTGDSDTERYLETNDDTQPSVGIEGEASKSRSLGRKRERSQSQLSSTSTKRQRQQSPFPNTQAIQRQASTPAAPKRAAHPAIPNPFDDEPSPYSRQFDQEQFDGSALSLD